MLTMTTCEIGLIAWLLGIALMIPGIVFNIRNENHRQFTGFDDIPAR